jgi:hypothetical protein
MRIEFLYWEDCPSHEEALARLRQIASEEGVSDPVTIIRIDSEQDAARERFPGSPTIRIDGVDLQPEGAGTVALSCRTYITEAGRISPLPTATMIRRALQSRRHTIKEVDDGTRAP